MYVSLLFLVVAGHPALHVDVTHSLTSDGSLFQDHVRRVPDHDTQLKPAAATTTATAGGFYAPLFPVH